MATLEKLHLQLSGERQLTEFEQQWDGAYPAISQSWRCIMPLFDYHRKSGKRSNLSVIESINTSLRKITKNCSAFLNDEALLKLFYLAPRNISKKWTMSIRD